MKIKPVKLEDFEKAEIEWWCLHHKEAVLELVLRIRQILDGDITLLKIMEAQLPGFIENCNLAGYIDEEAK